MNHTKCFDVAVLGLGTMGTFACLELARRKASVVAFDRFHPPHENGSHTGDTRVFREAYGEFPSYVPLAQHAGKLWDKLGAEASSTFLHRCGMLNVGPANSILISGIKASAVEHKLALEELSTKEVSKRFPAFSPPEDSLGIFEPSAGWVDVHSAINFGLERAAALGADLRYNLPVHSFEWSEGCFHIQTADGTTLAECLVVTAGAWSSSLLKALGLPLTVLRKVLVWVDPVAPELFSPDRFPIFSFSDSFVYGFPRIDSKGVKIAIHWDPNAAPTDAGVTQEAASPAELIPALSSVAHLMPKLAGALPEALSRVTQAKVCLYTMTPDEGFIVDRHPLQENIYIAAGFSGHGFKFAPAIGEALADLALAGATPLPIAPLKISTRFPRVLNKQFAAGEERQPFA